VSENRDVNDRALRQRAQRVIPGGMYGHGNVALMPEGFPQFFQSGHGCRVTDVDGNEYIDFMCGYGPNLLGLGHPKVEEAADKQRRLGNCFNGPTARMVELAELYVDTVRHAEWALFAKNGTDVTTACVTIARAATGKRKVLVSDHAYHGAAPWCTPSSAGIVDGDRAHLIYYQYNDLQSVEEAVATAGDDLAGIITSPFKHDAFADEELVDPAFARGLRRICDQQGAALIMDDVRAGFRLTVGGSWELLDVDPDLTAMSKAIANGYPLGVVLGSERFREAARSIYLTGSFWYSAVPMAAAIATLATLREENAIATMEAAGTRFREGLEAQSTSYGLPIRQTGPVQLPMVLFEDDPGFEKIRAFAREGALRGVYLHSYHNMFMCAAHRDEDIKEALERTDDAFASVRREFGAS
jgi:glutamate-1-semialdehyde 2,1-aminomutase